MSRKKKILLREPNELREAQFQVIVHMLLEDELLEKQIRFYLAVTQKSVSSVFEEMEKVEGIVQ